MKDNVTNGGAAETWRAEFPIQRDDERKVTRRGFCVSLGAAGACAAAINPWPGREMEANASEFETETGRADPVAEPIRLCPLGDLPEGGSLALKVPGVGPLLLIHLRASATGPSRIVAYDPRCTHLMCPTRYDASLDKIVCPCHHGFFSAEDGRALAGPPKKSLRGFNVEAREGNIFLMGRANVD